MTDHPNKPPYRVPLMEEVRALPSNGFLAASTFSGCGGSSLGYRMAGFRVGYANEFVDEAQETYRANISPGTFLDGRDIRTVKAQEVLDALGIKPGELDLLDGSPPCASFSTAGKRDAGWGDVKKYSGTRQRTDDLFFEFTRLLAGLSPRTFVAENVAGLVRGVAAGYFNEIIARLRACGYRVGARLLDAQWLGVPQQRQRIIFVGVREDLGIEPAYPKPFPYRYSVADACPWITRIEGGNAAAFDSKTKEFSVIDPSPTILARANRWSWVEDQRDGVSIEGTAIGAEWDKLREGEQSGRYFNLIRASRDAPSPTILASHGERGIAGVTHPTEKRKFSLAELRRICSFPDDFVLTGSYSQGWERLGRAVPPLMMRAVAEAVRDGVLVPARREGKIRNVIAIE